MQPTTPFNTQSWTIRAAEIASWLACAVFLYWRRWEGLSTATIIATGIVWAGYAFMRFCSAIHWHKGAQRGEGIEQHFTQVSVVAIYGLLIATVAAATHAGLFLIYVIAVILTAVSAIDATVLYLFHKDKSTVPTNYYSHNKYTSEDA